MNKSILISTSSFGKVNSKPLDMLKDAGFNITLNPYGKTLNQEQSIELLKGKVGVIAGTEKIDQKTFNQHPQLEYICRLGAGMDSVDVMGARDQGILVENTPNAHVDGVAELCLAGVLDLHRKISLAHSNLRNGIWNKPMGSLLKGKTVGLIGLGKVSKRLVELLTPFEVNILANDVFWDESFAGKHEVTKASLEDLLQNSDIVSLHIPYSKENKHIIGETQLALLKEDVQIVNTSRGGLIDEKALISFLRQNKLASAYLDTFEVEPYEGELISLDNVLLTPHIGSYAKEVRIRMELDCANKMIDFFK
jgi:D-3-phosphoglycerate dehydrogenase